MGGFILKNVGRVLLQGRWNIVGVFRRIGIVPKLPLLNGVMNSRAIKELVGNGIAICRTNEFPGVEVPTIGASGCVHLITCRDVIHHYKTVFYY